MQRSCLPRSLLLVTVAHLDLDLPLHYCSSIYFLHCKAKYQQARRGTSSAQEDQSLQAMAPAAPPAATSGSGSGSAAAGEKLMKEVLPPTLASNSQPPNLTDGTTRLYISYICPYVQRVWIARNFKGLQDKIQLVAVDLQDKPAWFLEKVYPPGKVPVLEHNGNVIAESLDLLSYLDANFEGPKLLPQGDPAKQAFAEELIGSSDPVIVALFRAGRASAAAGAGAGGDDISELLAPALDKVEEALGRFSDGPFFLGQSMSAVDMVYAPFVERFKDFFAAVEQYDITQGRPKLKEWIEELNKIDAYAATWGDRRLQIAAMMSKFGMKVPVA